MRKLEIRKCVQVQQPQTAVNMKKLVVVLTGGGAKGAFQVGAWSRIIQEGLNFDGETVKFDTPEIVFGVGAGAFNAEFISQGKNKELVKAWNKIGGKCDTENINDIYRGILLEGEDCTCSCDPLQQAVKYANQSEEKEEYYFLIISCYQDAKCTNRDIDLHEFIRINQLVKQAEEKGTHLYSEDGRILKRFNYKVIQPIRFLGSKENFTRSMVMDSYIHGYETAKRVIETPNWE